MKYVHDYEIISYEVNLRKEEIKINTENPSTEDEVQLIFNEVFAHYFENELFGSVILDICKETLENFMDYNKNLLEERKMSGWPMMYDDNVELLNELKKGKYSYYIISSSYGLRGWILAKDSNMED